MNLQRDTNIVRVSNGQRFECYEIERGSTWARFSSSAGAAGELVDLDEARERVAARLADGWRVEAA